MSACHAAESAFGVNVSGQLRALRRLLYCGEWIESHVLHIYMLHAPDFLGYPGAVEMAKDYPAVVKRGLELKKIGNKLVAFLGGREVHPINVRVGGFYKTPTEKELSSLEAELNRGVELAAETVNWVSTLEFEDFMPDYHFVSLSHPDEYPMNEGRVVSSKGLDLPIEDFDITFEEIQVKHSNALQCRLKNGESYFVGPMARYNLNFSKLHPEAQAAAKDAGLGQQCRNPFKSIVVRSVEVLHAFLEAVDIVKNYRQPDRPFVAVNPKEGVGYGCTEAPRGLLYHRYQFDDDGKILDAKIVPPTSQNQSVIEEDLSRFVSENFSLPKPELTHLCEQTIRNYDPCISCATHFLKLHIEE
ncbi:Ni/Fe hydrogenase subunit alpha [bacterium J17]|nr:Ni/Fe hydrogenase subunit alpha [bacterium J17]